MLYRLLLYFFLSLSLSLIHARKGPLQVAKTSTFSVFIFLFLLTSFMFLQETNMSLKHVVPNGRGNIGAKVNRTVHLLYNIKYVKMVRCHNWVRPTNVTQDLFLRGEVVALLFVFKRRIDMSQPLGCMSALGQGVLRSIFFLVLSASQTNYQWTQCGIKENIIPAPICPGEMAQCHKYKPKNKTVNIFKKYLCFPFTLSTQGSGQV